MDSNYFSAEVSMSRLHRSYYNIKHRKVDKSSIHEKINHLHLLKEGVDMIVSCTVDKSNLPQADWLMAIEDMPYTNLADISRTTT